MKPSNKWAPNTRLSFVMFFVVLVVAVTTKPIHQIDPNPIFSFTAIGIGAISLFLCIWRIEHLDKKKKSETARRWYYFASVISGLVVLLNLIAMGA